MNIINQVILHCTQYLTASEMAEIDHEISIMETREAAGIEALKIVQANRGWINDDSLTAIAQYLKMSTAELEGVATFYNLIYRQPVGKYVIHLCNSISCHLTGYDEILQTIKQYLSIDYGQTTADGLFTLLSNVCLGGCDKSPVMMIGDKHYQQLNVEKTIEVLTQLKNQANEGENT
jgi:NADH-quinone oxidoreductase subunit E